MDDTTLGAKPIALDLFCGLGGWAEGLIAAGWDVIGIDFDPRFIGRYPAQLVIHNVLDFCGRKARGKVQLVVASPDCREPSYRAMPWKRAKALNAEGPPHKFIELFNECFRIAEEIGCPVIVENVKGAQPWVGRAAWHYGSFYLWGDVPALMPPTISKKNTGGSWFGQRDGKPLERNDPRDMRRNEDGEYVNAEAKGGWNHPGKSLDGVKNGNDWFGSGRDCSLQRRASSRSAARKEASAQIAKIPFDLAYHIGQVFHP